LSSVRTLRYIALIEATSFLVLLVATIFKFADGSGGGVAIMGPVHGILFLAYVAIALSVRTVERWSSRTTVFILLGAVVPFGGFAVDRWLVKNSGAAAS
jgi:integral membrane protein